MKCVHKFFCTPESASTSVKEILITFSPSPERMLPNVEMNELNRDLTVLNLLDQITQTIKIVVDITIYQDDSLSCQALTETLHTVFVGPHPLHRKSYAINFNFIESMPFNTDNYCRSPYYNISKTKLCETLGECLALNSSITHVSMRSVTASDTSCIFTQLSQNDSISKLECLHVYNNPTPFLPPIPVDFLPALVNLISTNKTLTELCIDVPGLSGLFCAQFNDIKSVLINNTSLRKLTMCNGLYQFKRNSVTNEMEFTNPPMIFNRPLKNIVISPSTDVLDGTSSSPPPAK